MRGAGDQSSGPVSAQRSSLDQCQREWSCKAVVSPREPHEFLSDAVPDCLVRGRDLFSRRLSHKTVTTANTTIAIHVNE